MTTEFRKNYLDKVENRIHTRLYYFDFARSTFLIMGVFYHAAFIFSHKLWLIPPSEELSWIFDYLIIFIREFRMEGFFFISGFFAMMTILKRGKDYFIVNRMIRLGVPLFFFGLTVNVMIELFYLGEDLFFSFESVFSYFLSGNWLHHLWFLGVLIVMIFLTWISVVFFPALVEKIEKVEIPYLLFLLLLTGLVYLSRHLGFRIPESPFGEAWVFFVKSKFFYYFPFFIVGFVLYVKSGLLKKFISSWQINLSVALIQLVIIFGDFKESINPYLIEVLFPVGSICLVGASLFVFKNYFDRNSKTIQNVSEASYSIYLIHQPLIIVAAPYILKLNIYTGLEYIVLVGFVFMVSYFFHRFVLRKVPIAYFLMNGKWK